MAEEKLSDWFEGELYTEPWRKGLFSANVQNRFTGEEITLNAEELSVYNFIMGSHILSKNMRKGLKWFQSTNPEAYKILLE
jgi:hypothetical protein